MITHTQKTQFTARIFEDIGGFYICHASLDYLDTRGRCYWTRRKAIKSLRESLKWAQGQTYTHYLCNGRRVAL